MQFYENVEGKNEQHSFCKLEDLIGITEIIFNRK